MKCNVCEYEGRFIGIETGTMHIYNYGTQRGDVWACPKCGAVRISEDDLEFAQKYMFREEK